LEEFGAAGLFALAMFAVNSWQTFYVSEFKQYGVDVTAALLLLWLSLRAVRSEIRRGDFFWLGAAGAAVIWMSHASVFVLAGIGAALAFEKYARKKPIPFLWLLGMAAAWLVSFGVDYLVTLQYTAGDKFFRTYWMKSFLPLPPWSDIPWLLNVYGKFALIVLTSSGTALDNWVFFAALAGGAFLFFRRPAAALTLILPFFATLFASAWQKYPLSHRFMLFLVPLTLLLMAEALRGIYLLLARRSKPAALLACALFMAAFLYFPIFNAAAAFRFPSTISEMKPILQYVAEKRQAGDVVYIHYAAVPTFLYYAPFYQFDAEQALKGVYRQDSRKAFDRFFEDVAALRGNDRVWIIFSEIPYCGGCEGDPIAYFKNRLDDYGAALDEVSSVASAAYLYDLNP
ncbi:MAG: hypothetical protein LDL50_03790, partial [Chloroflexi bacterium]|nr:hypothetical protein [Chloroflexota bacterium]